MQAVHGKVLKDFLQGMEGNEAVADIRSRVEAWASQFAMPGFDVPLAPKPVAAAE